MHESYRQAAEATVAAGASKATYTGSATTMFGWLMSNEFIALGGFALAVLGFIVNLYFKIKDDRRNQALHAAQINDIASRKMPDARVADEIQRAVDARLSRQGDCFGGYGGMPKPPSNPGPKPDPDKDDGAPPA